MTRYLELVEYLWLAEQVTGVDAGTLARASRLDLADCALHAPAAGFGDEDFYPLIHDKAAVLCCRGMLRGSGSGSASTPIPERGPVRPP